MTTHLCADCRQPATCGLGTLRLCAWCKWAVQAAIYARRPDLRPTITDEVAC